MDRIVSNTECDFESTLLHLGRWSVSPARVLGYFPVSVDTVVEGKHKNVQEQRKTLRFKWFGINLLTPLITLAGSLIILHSEEERSWKFADAFANISSDATIFFTFSLVQLLNGFGIRIYNILNIRKCLQHWKENAMVLGKFHDVVDARAEDWDQVGNDCKGLFLSSLGRVVFLVVMTVFGDIILIDWLGLTGEAARIDYGVDFSAFVILTSFWCYFSYFHHFYCLWLTFFLRVYSRGLAILVDKVRDMTSNKMKVITWELEKISKGYDLLVDSVDRYESFFGCRVILEILYNIYNPELHLLCPHIN